jgi:hypothetical protein
MVDLFMYRDLEEVEKEQADAAAAAEAAEAEVAPVVAPVEEAPKSSEWGAAENQETA